MTRNMATGARPKWTVLEFILGPKEIGAPVMPIALRKVKRKYQVIFGNSLIMSSVDAVLLIFIF